MQTEFVQPEFLAGQDAAGIHARMLAQIPDEFDKLEGGFVWDMTYPTALEKAQAAQYLIPEALKCMFPLWAYGDMLDMHGANRGLTRRQASRAQCILTFSGADGTRIPAGTSVSTVATAEEKAVTFETTQAAAISGGTAEVNAKAAVAGADGNVAAGRICRLDETSGGITAVTNAYAAAGGVDIEGDDSFRQRITDYDAAQGQNYVGSAADYRRWALEVSGVGTAKVVSPDDDSGTVQLIITDVQGGSASETLCSEVYGHIMKPDDPENRLAPVNALLSVVTPAMLNIAISVSLTLDGISADDAKQAIAKAARAYFSTISDNKVRLSRVGALISGLKGVADYSGLTLGGSAANVELGNMQLPYIDESLVTVT